MVSVGVLLCIAAYARPAREHDSLIFLGTGLSESTRCVLGRQKARRSRRLLLSAGVIGMLMLCVSWVELFGLVRVGLG